MKVEPSPNLFRANMPRSKRCYTVAARTTQNLSSPQAPTKTTKQPSTLAISLKNSLHMYFHQPPTIEVGLKNNQPGNAPGFII